MKLNRSRLRRLIYTEINRLNEESDAKGVKIRQDDYDPTDVLPKNYATKKKASKAEQTPEERRAEMADQILEVGLNIDRVGSPILFHMLKEHLIELLNKTNEEVREIIHLAITKAEKGDTDALDDALKRLETK